MEPESARNPQRAEKNSGSKFVQQRQNLEKHGLRHLPLRSSSFTLVLSIGIFKRSFFMLEFLEVL